jgi:hypothetical protein
MTAPTRCDGRACSSSGSLGELDGLAHSNGQICFDIFANHVGLWRGNPLSGLVLREPKARCRNQAKAYRTSFRGSGDH